MKIEFLDDEHFVVYCALDEKLITESELKLFFKLLNQYLKIRYAYTFKGLYDVTIHCNHRVYVMDFKNIDDFGRADFNITVLMNSVLLCEFEEDDWVVGDKIYYKDRYYIEVGMVEDDIHLFEYGKIIYGDEVEEVLKWGKIIS